MPRAKSDTVEYFPHFVDDSRTIFILESEYGNDGYVFWFKLLELLACSDGHYFDMNKPGALRYLYAKTRVDADRAVKILDTLADMQKIDPELYRAKIIWCQKFVDNLGPLYQRRQRPLPPKPTLALQEDTAVSEPVTQREASFPNQLCDPGAISEPEMHQRRGKDSKGKEIRKEEPATVVAVPPSATGKTVTVKEPKVFHPEAIMLAEQWKNLLESQKPNIHKRLQNGYLVKWQEVFDRLILLDKRDPPEIEKIINHCFDEDRSWWARTNNILSPVKLRDRNKAGIYYYDLILEEMRNAAHQRNPKANGGNGPSKDWGDDWDIRIDTDTGEIATRERQKL